MASNKISMRLQTPPDESGNRKDVHIVTTADEVIVNPESDNPITLADKLKQTEIQIQEAKPDFACIWAKPVTSV